MLLRPTILKGRKIDENELEKLFFYKAMIEPTILVGRKIFENELQFTKADFLTRSISHGNCAAQS